MKKNKLVLSEHDEIMCEIFLSIGFVIGIIGYVVQLFLL